MVERSLRLLDRRGSELRVVERDEDRREVAESLVERGDLEVRRVPEVRPDRVEDRVALLVRHDVGAIPGLHDFSRLRIDVAEEVEGLPVVEGVQVFAVDRYRGENRAPHPRSRSGQEARPEGPPSAERGGDLPERNSGVSGS